MNDFCSIGPNVLLLYCYSNGNGRTYKYIINANRAEEIGQQHDGIRFYQILKGSCYGLGKQLNLYIPYETEEENSIGIKKYT